MDRAVIFSCYLTKRATYIWRNTYAYGNFAGRLYAGTGIGYAKLYRFIRYWPDEHIETLKVYTNGGENDFTHVWLEGNKLYNVTASGDRAAAVRAFIANYVN